MNTDAFVGGLLIGLLFGLAVGAWGMLAEIFGDSIPPLRDLGRELTALAALATINRSADRARQQLLDEARRHVGRGKT